MTIIIGDIYIATANKMEIPTNQQIVVEDSPRGVKSGVAAGSPVIGLPAYYLEQTIKPLEDAGASLIYREWPEVDLDYILSGKLTPH